ncbi:hypothetical protein PROFUN_08992 [Planoprotostelium fungivorum]|uniref:Uncharacterized protein n=1 Tax=Planoprotostelium fungivorum TaxID=1890364 RepID=A0A2P6NIM3_9EUKA|nr:hypothetical protein PROFUN_08992 [Planoprotostelium fungivorum]
MEEARMLEWVQCLDAPFGAFSLKTRSTPETGNHSKLSKQLISMEIALCFQIRGLDLSVDRVDSNGAADLVEGFLIGEADLRTANRLSEAYSDTIGFRQNAGEQLASQNTAPSLSLKDMSTKPYVLFPHLQKKHTTKAQNCT